MNAKNRLVWFVFFTLCVLLIGSCGQSAPPETRAGAWTATSDRGEFTIMVNSGGTGLSAFSIKYEMTLECSDTMVSGKMSFSQDINFSQDLPIEENSFSFEGSPKIEGKFGRDGTSASGTWEIGTCVSKWRAFR